MLKIFAILTALTLLLPAPAGARCRTWTPPDVICPGQGAVPMCVNNTGHNITCEPHDPKDCGAITENVTCSSEQEFNDFQAAHPLMKLMPHK